MRTGTKALQEYLSELSKGAKAAEKELPERIREIREVFSQTLDLVPAQKVLPGNGSRVHPGDPTVLIDPIGRGMQTVVVAIPPPPGTAAKPLSVSAILYVWRTDLWVAAINSGDALYLSEQDGALLAEFSKALEEQVRIAAYRATLPPSIEPGGGWGTPPDT